ncbi:MAG: sporulation protein YtfJ, partial [Clostridia bacterium]|nr:sporulation protein YtfJ [Clostridia bacterium]
MENESSIKEIIRNSLEQVRTIIDADTIVGKQIVTSSGMVIIPISKLSMGFASGGLDLPTKTEEGGKKNFGGGGGTGVSVVPVGFLTITPEGKVAMFPMTSEKLTPVEVVADLIYNS